MLKTLSKVAPKNKIYISGAITNDKDYKQKFDEAEKYLLSKGYEVFNPTSFKDISFNWTDYMRAYIKVLMDCQAVAVLYNLDIESKGRDLELFIANRLKMPIKFYKDF